MCEINPAHSKIFRLEFFTSNSKMTQEDFDALVTDMALEFEIQSNASGIVRCHVHEIPRGILTHGSNEDCPMVIAGVATRCPGHII